MVLRRVEGLSLEGGEGGGGGHVFFVTAWECVPELGPQTDNVCPAPPTPPLIAESIIITLLEEDFFE